MSTTRSKHKKESNSRDIQKLMPLLAKSAMAKPFKSPFKKVEENLSTVDEKSNHLELKGAVEISGAVNQLHPEKSYADNFKTASETKSSSTRTKIKRKGKRKRYFPSKELKMNAETKCEPASKKKKLLVSEAERESIKMHKCYSKNKTIQNEKIVLQEKIENEPDHNIDNGSNGNEKENLPIEENNEILEFEPDLKKPKLSPDALHHENQKTLYSEELSPAKEDPNEIRKNPNTSPKLCKDANKVIPTETKVYVENSAMADERCTLGVLKVESAIPFPISESVPNGLNESVNITFSSTGDKEKLMEDLIMSPVVPLKEIKRPIAGVPEYDEKLINQKSLSVVVTNEDSLKFEYMNAFCESEIKGDTISVKKSDENAIDSLAESEISKGIPNSKPKTEAVSDSELDLKWGNDVSTPEHNQILFPSICKEGESLNSGSNTQTETNLDCDSAVPHNALKQENIGDTPEHNQILFPSICKEGEFINSGSNTQAETNLDCVSAVPHNALKKGNMGNKNALYSTSMSHDIRDSNDDSADRKIIGLCISAEKKNTIKCEEIENVSALKEDSLSYKDIRMSSMNEKSENLSEIVTEILKESDNLQFEKASEDGMPCEKITGMLHETVDYKREAEIMITNSKKQLLQDKKTEFCISNIPLLVPTEKLNEILHYKNEDVVNEKLVCTTLDSNVILYEDMMKDLIGDAPDGKKYNFKEAQLHTLSRQDVKHIGELKPSYITSLETEKTKQENLIKHYDILKELANTPNDINLGLKETESRSLKITECKEIGECNKQEDNLKELMDATNKNNASLNAHLNQCEEINELNATHISKLMKENRVLEHDTEEDSSLQTTMGDAPFEKNTSLKETRSRTLEVSKECDESYVIHMSKSNKENKEQSTEDIKPENSVPYSNNHYIMDVTEDLTPSQNICMRTCHEQGNENGGVAEEEKNTYSLCKNDGFPTETKITLLKEFKKNKEADTVDSGMEIEAAPESVGTYLDSNNEKEEIFNDANDVSSDETHFISIGAKYSNGINGEIFKQNSLINPFTQKEFTIPFMSAYDYFQSKEDLNLILNGQTENGHSSDKGKLLSNINPPSQREQEHNSVENLSDKSEDFSSIQKQNIEELFKLPQGTPSSFQLEEEESFENIDNILKSQCDSQLPQDNFDVSTPQTTKYLNQNEKLSQEDNSQTKVINTSIKDYFSVSKNLVNSEKNRLTDKLMSNFFEEDGLNLENIDFGHKSHDDDDKSVIPTAVFTPLSELFTYNEKTTELLVRVKDSELDQDPTSKTGDCTADEHEIQNEQSSEDVKPEKDSIRKEIESVAATDGYSEPMEKAENQLDGKEKTVKMWPIFSIPSQSCGDKVESRNDEKSSSPVNDDKYENLSEMEDCPEMDDDFNLTASQLSQLDADIRMQTSSDFGTKKSVGSQTHLLGGSQQPCCSGFGNREEQFLDLLQTICNSVEEIRHYICSSSN